MQRSSITGADSFLDELRQQNMQLPSPRTGGPTTPGAGSSPSKIFGSAEDEDVKPLPEEEFKDFHSKYD